MSVIKSLLHACMQMLFTQWSNKIRVVEINSVLNTLMDFILNVRPARKNVFHISSHKAHEV